MPQDGGEKLRIYCICGQKMKVSKNHYGLPGKCIACRQKIRLPREDELEEGVTEIYLKDHPQLLRKVKRKPDVKKETADAQAALDSVPKPKKSKDSDPTPVTELDLADAAPVSDEDVVGSRPLDKLESVQKLASLELGYERKIERFSEQFTKDEARIAETKGKLARAKEARKDLNEQIRQRLMEVAIELTNAQDKISQTQVAARVGEEPFEQFQDKMHRLRARRDRLERRQINLRGWLAAATPYDVGGPVECTSADIPKGGFSLNVPESRDEDAALLHYHAQALKQAFEFRAKAERRAVELKKVRNESEDGGGQSLTDSYETNRAERKRARARITFHQQRLLQLSKDYKNDLDTLESYLESARDRLSMNQMTRTDYDKLDQTARRTKADLTKGISLATRLAHANSFEDVPSTKGTFLNRLGAGAESDASPRAIMGVLWTAAALWLFSVVLPTAGGTSLLSAFLNFSGASSDTGIVLALPIIAGITTIGISFVMNPLIRGAALLGLWSLTAITMAFVINEAHFSLDLLANRFRSGGNWIARPGIIALILANLLLLFGGIQALNPRPGARGWLVGVVVATLAFATWLGSNGFDSYLPNPELELLTDTFSEQTGKQSGTVRISNTGTRTMHLVSRKTDARNGYLYGFEKKIGATSFNAVTPEGEPLGLDGNYPNISIAPRSSEDITFELPPGDFRMVLTPKDVEDQQELRILVEDLQRLNDLLPAGDEPVFPEDDPQPNTPVQPSDDTPDPAPEMSDPELAQTIELEYPAATLNGVFTGPSGVPQFTMTVYRGEDHDPSQDRFMMEAELHDGWSIIEYDPSQSAVTVRKARTLLIIKRGERVVLQERS